MNRLSWHLLGNETYMPSFIATEGCLLLENRKFRKTTKNYKKLQKTTKNYKKKLLNTGIIVNIICVTTHVMKGIESTFLNTLSCFLNLLCGRASVRACVRASRKNVTLRCHANLDGMDGCDAMC